MAPVDGPIDGSVSGSCLCGKVCLSINGFDRNVIACHCTQCRKQTGHFVAAARVANTQMNVQGEEHLNWFSATPEAQRGFCKHCGSVMFWRSIRSDYTSVMAGCLDKPTGLHMDRHIFVDDKGDYYDIESGVSTYAQSD